MHFVCLTEVPQVTFLEVVVSAAVVVLMVFIATGRGGLDGHIAEPSKKPQKNFLKVTTNVD